VFAAKGRKTLQDAVSFVRFAAEMAIASEGWFNDGRVEDVANEGSCFSKEDLRQVQGHSPPWGGASDLRKLET
jgi:hypothetical protein